MYRSHFYPKWSINLIRVLPIDIYLLSYKIVNFPYFIVCGGSMTGYDSTTIGWIYFISFVLTCCCEVSASQQTAFHLYSSLFTKFYFILFNYLRDIFSTIYKSLTSWLFMLSHFILLFYHHCTWHSRWDHHSMILPLALILLTLFLFQCYGYAVST